MLFIHLHLCEYCTGITHSYPLLIWRLCKYVGKIDKLFVRILIEDRGWVWVKPRIERQCIGMRKLNWCCAQKTLSIFSLLAKLGQNCQCLLRMHHRSLLNEVFFSFHIIFIFCQDINKGCLSTPDERVTCGFHFSIFFKTDPHCPVLLDTLSLSTKSSGVVLRVFICSLYEQQAKSRWLRCDRPELAARIVTTAVVSLAEQSWKNRGNTDLLKI